MDVYACGKATTRIRRNRTGTEGGRGSAEDGNGSIYTTTRVDEEKEEEDYVWTGGRKPEVWSIYVYI